MKRLLQVTPSKNHNPKEFFKFFLIFRDPFYDLKTIQKVVNDNGGQEILSTLNVPCTLLIYMDYFYESYDKIFILSTRSWNLQ